jgi:tetratricopeptide (TPR) repeat protein
MRRQQPAKAIADLEKLAPPLDFAAPSALLVATLFPTYVRGQAYLALGDENQAIIEFRKFGEHKGLTVNYPLSPLAQLGLARAYRSTGNLDKAGKAYDDLLKLWEDADDDLPSLRQAKSEYAKLQSFRH